MTLEQLYITADNLNITVIDMFCPASGSVSLKTDEGCCFIGLDDGTGTCEEKKVRLAHEIGHCATDSFYSRHTLLDNIRKHERRADKWAINSIIPLDELIDEFKYDYVEPWEIADYFGVTLDYVDKALKLYGFIE